MKTSPLFKILSVVVLAAVLLYFGVQISQYLSNPFSTTLAYEYIADDSVETAGLLVRTEQVLPGQSGIVDLRFDDE